MQGKKSFEKDEVKQEKSSSESTLNTVEERLKIIADLIVNRMLEEENKQIVDPAL